MRGEEFLFFVVKFIKSPWKRGEKMEKKLAEAMFNYLSLKKARFLNIMMGIASILLFLASVTYLTYSNRLDKASEASIRIHFAIIEYCKVKRLDYMTHKEDSLFNFPQVDEMIKSRGILGGGINNPTNFLNKKQIDEFGKYIKSYNP